MLSWVLYFGLHREILQLLYSWHNLKLVTFYTDMMIEV